MSKLNYSRAGATRSAGASSRVAWGLLSFLLCGIASLQAEIDWTPRVATTAIEGPTVRRLTFTDGKSKFAMAFDGETTAVSEKGGVRFTYTNLEGAFTIRPQKPVLQLPAEPLQLPEYRKVALEGVPAGASELEIIEEEMHVLPINNWKTLRFTFFYNFFGRRHKEYVTFLTFADGTQARLETAATTKDFEQVQARAEYMIRSWHELSPRDLLPSKN